MGNSASTHEEEEYIEDEHEGDAEYEYEQEGDEKQEEYENDYVKQFDGIETLGYRVLGVQPDSPASKAGLVSFFDFIVGANQQMLLGSGVELEEGDEYEDVDFPLLLKQAHEQHASVDLLVWNIKSQEKRVAQIHPTSEWGGAGLLGVTIKLDNYGGADEHLIRVLEIQQRKKGSSVQPSPAELAGLIPGKDFLLGTTATALTTTEVLASVLELHLNKVVELYVYNSSTDLVRIVGLHPTYQWGDGGSLLGAAIGTGYLHKLPTTCRTTTGKSIERRVSVLDTGDGEGDGGSAELNENNIRMEGTLEMEVVDDDSELDHDVGLAANQDRARHPHQLGMRTTNNDPPSQQPGRPNRINDSMKSISLASNEQTDTDTGEGSAEVAAVEVVGVPPSQPTVEAIQQQQQQHEIPQPQQPQRPVDPPSSAERIQQQQQRTMVQRKETEALMASSSSYTTNAFFNFVAPVPATRPTRPRSTASERVQMTKELFYKFDVDQDERLNYEELNELFKATSEVGNGVSQDTYVTICQQQRDCYPEDGLSVNALIYMYVSSGGDGIDGDIDTDYDRVFNQTTIAERTSAVQKTQERVQKVQQLFHTFDVDQDARLNYQELNALWKATASDEDDKNANTNHEPPVSAQMYITICQSPHVNCSPDEGLTVAALLQMYNVSDGSVGDTNMDQVDIDYQRVFSKNNGNASDNDNSGELSKAVAVPVAAVPPPPPLSTEQQQQQLPPPPPPTEVATEAEAVFDSPPPTTLSAAPLLNTEEVIHAETVESPNSSVEGSTPDHNNPTTSSSSQEEEQQELMVPVVPYHEDTDTAPVRPVRNVSEGVIPAAAAAVEPPSDPSPASPPLSPDVTTTTTDQTPPPPPPPSSQEEQISPPPPPPPTLSSPDPPTVSHHSDDDDHDDSDYTDEGSYSDEDDDGEEYTDDEGEGDESPVKAKKGGLLSSFMPSPMPKPPIMEY